MPLLFEGLDDVLGNGHGFFVGYGFLVEGGHPFAWFAHDPYNILGCFDTVGFAVPTGKGLVALDDIAAAGMTRHTMLLEFGFSHLAGGIGRAIQQ